MKRVAFYLGQFWMVLAFLALVGAWITQLSGQPLLGMSQQHLFNDAIVLALLGIGSLLDSLCHTKGL